jgi:hypothetical protein
MTREEFRLKAIIEIGSNMAMSSNLTTGSNAWKQQIDRAIKMAEYLTEQVYGPEDTDIYTIEAQ